MTLVFSALLIWFVVAFARGRTWAQVLLTCGGLLVGTLMVIGAIRGAWSLGVFLVAVLLMCAVVLSWSPGTQGWFEREWTSRSQ